MPEVVNTTKLSDFAAFPEDAGRETMIAVDNVSMIFNMANEQLNSLKEYAIALARRELRFKELRSLDGITLDVKRGDVFGILGTNGSGKSTLLKIIAGVLEPTKGSCTINGNIAPLIELGAGFDMELTARENIFLNGAILGYPKDFLHDKAPEIIAYSELDRFIDRPLKTYSSGMLARLAFSIATVVQPDILIVDEILAVGDERFQRKSRARMLELMSGGATVLFVSHNLSQIRELCDRVIWLEHGRIRAQGDAKALCDAYEREAAP